MIVDAAPRSEPAAGLAEQSSVLVSGGTALACLLAVGLLLRLAVISSPAGALDGDEAIVGLMARHILQGEWPAFYWSQPQGYLGALEAYSAAPFFALLGSTAFALKLVPALYSLGFIVLSYFVARRLFGPGPAVLTAAYLAVPPMMLAVWSVKARGGYAESLFFGEAVLLLTLMLPGARRPMGRSALLGVCAGLGFWTNPLILVYLLPAAVFLLLTMRGRLIPLLPFALLGFLPGLLPSLAVPSGNPLTAMFLAASSVGAQPMDIPQNLQVLTFVGLPVLVGLAPPIGEPNVWALDWPTRPASVAPLVLAVDGALLFGLAAHGKSMVKVFRGEETAGTGPALLVATVLATVIALPLSTFGDLGGEPRYALPLYTAAPLYAALLWRLRAHGLLPFVFALMATFAPNAYSVLASEPQLPAPPSTGRSTPENRALLIEFLTRSGHTHIYADYWLAYPLAFESGERIVPYVMSSGPNRYAPFAEQVIKSPRFAYVVIRGSPPAIVLYERMEADGVKFQVESVSIYEIITEIGSYSQPERVAPPNIQETQRELSDEPPAPGECATPGSDGLDLLLSDVESVDLNGLDLARAIRADPTVASMRLFL